MIKKLMCMAMLLIGALGLNAQEAPASPQLPLNPAVRHGVLPNGMNYYLLHNEEPKGRANFYIAQKVGSTLETPEQLGLAHFLEHMAFNGTTNFPGKDMLNKLQAKGLRFGADINAYTAFDQTVYNIDNVPTDDQELMDMALLVLHDWADEISLLDAEIDAERKVIQEEWRMRNNAQTRMYTSLLPQIFKEYQYQQMPIGKMEIVMNFPYKALRDYYEKWYRPDQQGLIIVGDFDVDKMEEDVKKLFSSIKMPENAAERVYPHVSDNKEPIYATFTDPEQQVPMILVMFKSDKLSFEDRNSVDGYFMQTTLQDMLARMINTRLDEMAQKADCPFASASVYFSDFLVAKTKEAFNIQIIAKDDVQAAIDAAMAAVTRACKAGFTEQEVKLASADYLAAYEKRYNERDKTKTSVLANELIDTFCDNTPNPGIETEYQLQQAAASQLHAAQYNALAQQLLTPENQVIVVALPESMASQMPEKDTLLGKIENTLNAEYEAYEDVKLPESLIPNLPKAGKVKKEKNGVFGTTEMTLSNGVKVVVKNTDFAADEIRMTAVRKGGKLNYSDADAANIVLMDLATETAKLGEFDNIMLQKYLSGKTVSLGYGMNVASTTLTGSSSVKDFETLMELTHAYFTELKADNDTYNAQVSSVRTYIANQDKNPDKIFQDSVSAAMYNHNPMFQSVSVKLLDEASNERMIEIARESMTNAADFTFIFVGNIDAATLKPYLEKYIANLPSKGKPSKVTEVPFRTFAGMVNVDWKQPMETPSTSIFTNMSGTMAYNIFNDVKIDLVGQILSNIYTETLREEEGGAYSPYAYSYLNKLNSKWFLISSIQTNADQQAQMINRSKLETDKLLSQGATEDQFTKVKEAALNQYKINVRKNGYWMNNLVEYYNNGYDMVTDNQKAIEGLTLSDFNAFMKTLTGNDNFLKVVMEGVSEKK